MKKLVSGLFLFAAACGSPPVPSTTPRAVATGDAPASAPSNGNVSFAMVASAPVSLTASDGTGLRLAKLDAEAVVDGPLAFTEMRLTFENPQDRTLEGTFRLALPQGASLGRFAMKIGDEWQEGEVVELAAARRAYEDFLHRKQDPALMEKSAGNEFSARVFPIPARGKKEIVVSYVSELGDAPYVLPLRGLPELGELRAKADVIGAKTQPAPLLAHDTAPSSDFVVARAPASASDGVRSGDLAIVRVKPQAQSKPDPLGNAIVLVDTSASRALGFKDEVAIVDSIVKRIEGSVTVACFDQVVAPIYQGPAKNFGAAERQKIEDVGALGASNVEQALAWAQSNAKTIGAKRVVIVGDGVATAGATDGKKLAARAAQLRDGGVERLDAVAVGGIRDDEGLARLVRGNLAHDGVVAKAEDGEQVIARRLGEATRSGVAVKIDGANWAWPQRLDGVQAGDTYAIYAEVPAGKPVRVSLDGAAAQVVDLRATARPLVERSVAQAKVASLLERETTSKEDLKKSIIEIATQHRIMTPYTAMLVLETEADYARFHIDRKSLTDVLAIEDGSVRRMHRTFKALPDPTMTDGDAFAKNDESKDEAKKELMTERAPSTPRSAAPEPPKPAGQPGAPPPPPPPPPSPAPRQEEREAALRRAGAIPNTAPPADAQPARSQAYRGGASSVGGASSPRPAMRPSPVVAEARMDADGDTADSSRPKVDPYSGKFANVMG
ncbi:MAG TPA: VIT and VWA domain-containing protein, partial [Labilithrix sp.]